MPTKEELEQTIVELKETIEKQQETITHLNGIAPTDWFKNVGIAISSAFPFVAAEIDFQKGRVKCFDTGRFQPLNRFKNRKHILFFINEPPPEVADVAGAEEADKESVDGGG